MLDEINEGDLNEHIDLFENKVENIRDKTKALLEKAKNFESHNDQLPEILTRFRSITELFTNGKYKEMIVGELEKNYN